jgi:signal transduction histidine kinase
MFEKFHQVYAQGTSGERSRRLGLAITRRLVELHGGWIEVASEEQHSSTFTTHMPARAETRALSAWRTSAASICLYKSDGIMYHRCRLYLAKVIEHGAVRPARKGCAGDRR